MAIRRPSLGAIGVVTLLMAGLVAAVINFSLDEIVLLVAVGMTSGLFAAVWTSVPVNSGAGRRIAVLTGAGAVGVVASTGLVARFGIVGLCAVWIIVAYVRRHPHRALRGVSKQPIPVDDGQPLAAPRTMDVTGLDDVELCRWWRCTYPAAVKPSSQAQLVELFDLRATLLAELERRDPAGLRRWIESGARAGGDPLPHLTSSRGAAKPRLYPPSEAS